MLRVANTMVVRFRWQFAVVLHTLQKNLFLAESLLITLRC